MELNSTIKSMINSIMETNEYKEFKIKRKEYGNNKNFMKKINDFKEIQFQLYQSKLHGKEIDSKKKSELTAKAEVISKNQMVQHYLNAEANFHNFMYNTFNKISDDIEKSFK